MRLFQMHMRRLASGASAAVTSALIAGQVHAQEILGQPTPGGVGLQAAASPLKESAHFFHDAILMPIITAISLFVLALLVWVVLRFNRKANPTPAKWSHNTALEIVWTVVPVLILMFIAIFSFRLLFQYHDMPKPDLTVKATGYQWYWGYEYPDLGIGEVTSVMLAEDDAKAAGRPYRLAVDQPLVVPVGKTVRVLVTGADVIHAFGVPAFGVMVDAIPGRVNETWFRADKPGIYYGNCRELCGVDHAFMPIQINVVSEADFVRYVAQNGGTYTPGRPTVTQAVAAGAAPPATPAGAAAAGAAPGPGDPAAPANAQGRVALGGRGEPTVPTPTAAQPAAPAQPTAAPAPAAAPAQK
jgi:cytochrome c oxidase subunit 2